MTELKITETVLRDGNQSLAATRMPVDEMLPVLEVMDRVGYASIECWGGATFDACLRYLNEDPWERLRLFRKKLPHTKLQMLMRGQCILGYRHYPDDIVRRFVENACQNGIDIIRIFDALNDVENLKVAVDETVKNGKEASCALSFTKSPYHHLKDYVDLAQKLVDIGASSICIKDMSGILSPTESYELISRLKDNFDVPIILHSHCTSGLAYVSYYEAIRAGVDVVDTSVSSFSGGTSQPATELILQFARELGREVTLDESALSQVNDHFKGVRERMEKEGKISFKSMIPHPDIITTQIPGGMYSNLVSQMKNQGMEEKLPDVLGEVPKVRKDMGYPPLVTPISQMIGAQATTNIVLGRPYQYIASELRDYFLGKYGKPPGEINSELARRIAAEGEGKENRDSEVQIVRFEDQTAYKPCSSEEKLTYQLFPELARKNLYKREEKNYLCWGDTSRKIPSAENISDINLETEKKDDGNKILRSSLPGNVVKMYVAENEKVSAGQVLMVIETMKMENKIISDVDGSISNVFVSQGATLSKGDPLLQYAAN